MSGASSTPPASHFTTSSSERAALRSELADRDQALDSVSRELVSLQALQAEAEIARTELQAEHRPP